MIPPHAAFIMSGVPSSLYVPIISTGIGNIQFFFPRFFFIVLFLSFSEIHYALLAVAAFADAFPLLQ